VTVSQGGKGRKKKRKKAGPYRLFSSFGEEGKKKKGKGKRRGKGKRMRERPVGSILLRSQSGQRKPTGAGKERKEKKPPKKKRAGTKRGKGGRMQRVGPAIIPGSSISIDSIIDLLHLQKRGGVGRKKERRGERGGKRGKPTPTSNVSPVSRSLPKKGKKKKGGGKGKSGFFLFLKFCSARLRKRKGKWEEKKEKKRKGKEGGEAAPNPLHAVNVVGGKRGKEKRKREGGKRCGSRTFAPLKREKYLIRLHWEEGRGRTGKAG